MTVAVKNDNKRPLVVPTTVRRKAGFKSGEELEFSASGGVITIAPKLTAADEYTPEARRAIDERLAKGEAEIKAGRVDGPFTAKDAAAFIERLAKQRALTGKRPTRSRK